MEGPFLVKSLWSSCWIPQKEGAGVQGSWRWDSSAQAWCSLGKGSFRSAVHDIGWMLYRIRYRPRYFMTWSSISNVIKALDIVYDINIRYRTFYVRYRRDETSISIKIFMAFDIQGDLRYRIMIPSISTYDIEGAKRWYRIGIRYPSLRMLRSISKARSDTQYRGGSRCTDFALRLLWTSYPSLPVSIGTIGPDIGKHPISGHQECPDHDIGYEVLVSGKSSAK